MIIARAPFRVSFCGGGSDIPVFYEKYGGCVLSCSIRKYVYIAIHPSFNKDIITLKYSKTEEVKKFNDIEHKYFRHILEQYNLKGVEITSMADIPSGTGLGSSSTFTVALIKAIKAYKKLGYSKYAIAEEACDIEINKAKSPIGKQDQFAASFGGINFITFNKDGKVNVEPILIPNDGEEKLQNNIMIFYTGLTHSANDILSIQSKNIVTDEQKIASQLQLCKMAKNLKKHLENGDIDYIGKVLKESWELKKSLCKDISNSCIDDIYNKAMSAGASGGKLLGAGGGGFMLFYVKPSYQDKVRKALKDFSELEFKIDYDGATIVYGLKS